MLFRIILYLCHALTQKMIKPDIQYFPFLSGDEILHRVACEIRLAVSQYLRQSKLQALVLGVSGGIDSALCAALLQPVCREAGIPLVGRSITIETNSEDEIARSVNVGETFCDDFECLDLTDTFFVNRKNLIRFDDSRLSRMRQGNLKARMRMMILYDLSQLYRGLVISTDNYTEYLCGFWTLHGDVGDYGPIRSLWKTEVYRLSEFLLCELSTEQHNALCACIDAVPVDGLGISSCDCEQLGVANYFEADRIFAAYFQGDVSLESHVLIQRYLHSDFKRHNPVNIPREVIARALNQ